MPEAPPVRPARWPWISAVLAVIVFLDLIAVAVYLWGIPTDRFGDLQKVVTILASWLASVAAAFGIRYKSREAQPLRAAFERRPVRLGIVAATIVIWFFVLPFHSVTIATYDEDLSVPLPGVVVLAGNKHMGPTALERDSSRAIRKVTGLSARGLDVRLEMENYEPQDRSLSFIDVLKFGSASEDFVLTRAMGFLLLTSIPPGAAVYLDHDSIQSSGTTPLVREVTAGEHWIKFGPAGDHLATGWDRVGVTAGDSVRHERSLPVPEYGVRIFSEPPGAECFIDGAAESIGITPCDVTLTAGRHSIRLTMQDYGEARRQLDVHRDQTIRLELSRIPSQ